jgi:hypothetical protein
MSMISDGQAQALGRGMPAPTSISALSRGVMELDPALKLRIDTLDGSLQSLAVALQAPISSVSSENCKMPEAPTTPAMSTNAPASVDIRFGDTPLGYRVTGGTGAFVAQWIGTEPPDVMAAMQGDALRIFVKPGLEEKDFKDGKSYQLDVYDLSPGAPKHLPTPITINTKKKT